MLLNILKSKIHRAKITQADLNYIGSITIDEDLMKASGIRENEQVDVADITNGSRLTTYAIPGKAGSGVICLNGAAARLVEPGHLVIIMSYALMAPEEADVFKPKVVFVNEADNTVLGVKDKEAAATAFDGAKFP